MVGGDFIFTFIEKLFWDINSLIKFMEDRTSLSLNELLSKSKMEPVNNSV
jgi:hypothetical protein